MQYVGIRLGKQELAERVKTLRDSIFALGEKEKLNESSTFLYQQLIEALASSCERKGINHRSARCASLSTFSRLDVGPTGII